MAKKSAIVGFGKFIPSLRIRTEEIADANNESSEHIISGLGIKEKSVPDSNEDAYTMAHEAGKEAIDVAGLEPSQISAVFVGSESHPYAVKPTSGMVASSLGLHPFCHAADLEFACKAGTAGVQMVDSFVRSGQVRFGLAIGTDTAQASPGDALEYSAAAGAAALILGPENHENAFARIDHTLSFTTDTPDFWRANDEAHPRHAGRFTGEPAYFHHVREALNGILTVSKKTITEIDHVVLHMPNAKFPSRVAKEFGCTKSQMEHGFIVPEIGNTYSACSMLGLVSVLQKAKKDESILVVSYGSGAGSDAFLLTMLRNGVPLDQPEAAEYISYTTYRQKCHA